MSTIELQQIHNDFFKKVNFKFIFLYRMGIHQGSLQSNRRIENVPSFFRSIREAQRTQKTMTCLSFSTVRKSLLSQKESSVYELKSKFNAMAAQGRYVEGDSTE